MGGTALGIISGYGYGYGYGYGDGSGDGYGYGSGSGSGSGYKKYLAMLFAVVGGSAS